jgi:hypothetical protein
MPQLNGVRIHNPEARDLDAVSALPAGTGLPT